MTLTHAKITLTPGNLYRSKSDVAPGRIIEHFSPYKNINNGWVVEGDVLFCLCYSHCKRTINRNETFCMDVWFYNLTRKHYFLLERGLRSPVLSAFVEITPVNKLYLDKDDTPRAPKI